MRSRHASPPSETGLVRAAPPLCYLGTMNPSPRKPRLTCLLALLLVGCASMGNGTRVDPVVAGRVFEQAAAQVKRCYRTPRVPSAARQIATRLSLRLNPDGTLSELPTILEQSGVTPENQAYAGEMAEAASLAAIRCAPLRLPPDLYEAVWSSFELKFSPKVSV